MDNRRGCGAGKWIEKEWINGRGNCLYKSGTECGGYGGRCAVQGYGEGVLRGQPYGGESEIVEGTPVFGWGAEEAGVQYPEAD